MADERKTDDYQQRRYKVFAAISALIGSPSAPRARLEEIDSALKSGDMTKQIAVGLLCDMLEHGATICADSSSIADEKVHGQVKEFFDRVAEDIFQLAQEHGLALGEHSRRILAEVSSKTRNK